MTIIYLSAAEPYPYLIPNYPNWLMSYLRRGPALDVLADLKTKGVVKRMMIDSGAFSFFTSHGVSATGRTSNSAKGLDPFEYTHDYCRWLISKRFHKLADYYIEMDLDKLLGWEKQQELRRIFESYNLAPMMVWHPTNKWTLEEYCKRYDYFGVGSSVTNTQTLLKILRTVKKYDARVHFFGYTKLQGLPLLNQIGALESVDSSTWLNCSKFGMYYSFQNGRMIFCDFDKFMKKYGSDKKFSRLPNKTKMTYTILEWRKLQDNMMKMSKCPHTTQNPNQAGRSNPEKQ